MSHFKYFGIGIVVALIGLSFQNCAKGSAGASNEENLEAHFVRSDAKGFSVLHVNEQAVLNSQDDVGASLNKSSENRYFKIDLNLSSIQLTDRRGNSVGSAVSLSNEDRDNLTNLLNDAEICEPVNTQSSSVACTMIYTYPYVELVNGSEIKKLGERSNGCDPGIDLCDQKNKDLKIYLKDILDKI